MTVVRLGRLKFLISFKNLLKYFKSFRKTPIFLRTPNPSKHQQYFLNVLRITMNRKRVGVSEFGFDHTLEFWFTLRSQLMRQSEGEEEKKLSEGKKLRIFFFLYQKGIKYIFLFFRYIECTLFLVLQRNNRYSSFF